MEGRIIAPAGVSSRPETGQAWVDTREGVTFVPARRPGPDRIGVAHAGDSAMHMAAHRWRVALAAAGILSSASRS
jgi:hypothetical protein